MRLISASRSRLTRSTRRFLAKSAIVPLINVDRRCLFRPPLAKIAFRRRGAQEPRRPRFSFFRFSFQTARKPGRLPTSGITKGRRSLSSRKLSEACFTMTVTASPTRGHWSDQRVDWSGLYGQGVREVNTRFGIPPFFCTAAENVADRRRGRCRTGATFLGRYRSHASGLSRSNLRRGGLSTSCFPPFRHPDGSIDLKWRSGDGAA